MKSEPEPYKSTSCTGTPDTNNDELAGHSFGTVMSTGAFSGLHID